jgi:hypothetical protein
MASKRKSTTGSATKEVASAGNKQRSISRFVQVAVRYTANTLFYLSAITLIQTIRQMCPLHLCRVFEGPSTPPLAVFERAFLIDNRGHIIPHTRSIRVAICL